MVVIKVGGSLAGSGLLRQCLDNVRTRYPTGQIVIVPGGGGFADQVRSAQLYWQFDDRIAHKMAILAMQQMALLVNGLRGDFILAHSVAAIQNQQQPLAVWSPDITELDNAGIKASWDITSDSLAAWLARQLGASELVLVKSVPIDAKLNLVELAELNIVDNAFGVFTENAPYLITLLHANTF